MPMTAKVLLISRQWPSPAHTFNTLSSASHYALVIKIMNTQIKHKFPQDNGLPIASVDNFPEKSRACFGKLHQIHLLGILFHYRVSAVHLWGGLITGCLSIAWAIAKISGAGGPGKLETGVPSVCGQQRSRNGSMGKGSQRHSSTSMGR